MAPAIPVYIIAKGDPKSDHVAKLIALFDSDYFTVTVVQSKDDISHHDNERKAFIYALTNAQEIAENEPCIIIKDCMFSNLSASDMLNLIQNIINSNLAWDLVYLSRYLDKCNGNIVLPNITSGGSLVTTKHAEGDDAIMYSAATRDALIPKLQYSHETMSNLLHNELAHDKLKGTAASPPVFQYNPIFGELVKTWECERHIPPPPPAQYDYNYLFIAFVILFLIIVILLVWWLFW